MALVYSCCFWFSLRLGGIIIGIFSIGTFILSLSCLAHSHPKEVEAELNKWYKNWNLDYYKEYLENIMQDSKKYSSLSIGISTIYLILCVMYIYGAFICNNLLMFGYILSELLRLIAVAAMVATGLLLLKQNTMDIGFLIGATVVAGFFLLGMFYLWVCAASLPVLINEMERDEQAATIAKLQSLLDTSQRTSRDNYTGQPTFGRGVFIIRKHRPFDTVAQGSRIPIAY